MMSTIRLFFDIKVNSIFEFLVCTYVSVHMLAFLEYGSDNTCSIDK
jgi:hypothetical protein